jgi:hypothetical protein
VWIYGARDVRDVISGVATRVCGRHASDSLILLVALNM